MIREDGTSGKSSALGVVSIEERFAPFAERMRAEGLPDLAIRAFKYYYTQLIEGQTGMIPESEIEPVESLPDAEKFSDELAREGEAALPKTVMIKLNGGLGTSMGLSNAKSLLGIKDGYTILDIIAHQAIQANVPLVLMNSYSTREDSLQALQKYPQLRDSGIDPDFLQHKVPKVMQADFSPAIWPADPQNEWCPPGHGDIYISLVTSGMLARLLKAGYEYAFVSNCDNLGSVLEKAILGYFAHNRIPFMMEVAERTEMDQKGGHIARRLDGQLILREGAQCPPEDQASFRDIRKHRYFNANSLWINLPRLEGLLEEHDHLLTLPLIRNSKTLDPCNSASPAVYQLETAMGAAIGIIHAAQVVRVPSQRLAPIKTTSDLLVVRSDAYTLTSDYRLLLDPLRSRRPVVSLDGRFYESIVDLEARFPYGAPSLLHCQRFTVEGDICFGKNVVLEGDVRLINPSARPAIVENVTLADQQAQAG
jgi:UTP--glucose-1-phosphate uridylyltransferase